jgi:hypothetical protein
MHPMVPLPFTMRKVQPLKKQTYDAIIQIPANYDIETPKKVSINCTSEKSLV